jgi:hypothetical protein
MGGPRGRIAAATCALLMCANGCLGSGGLRCSGDRERLASLRALRCAAIISSIVRWSERALRRFDDPDLLGLGGIRGRLATVRGENTGASCAGVSLWSGLAMERAQLSGSFLEAAAASATEL